MMKRKFNAVLWKIGASVVFTIPSSIIKEFGRNSFLFADINANSVLFSVMMKPWKCGGSVVFTIPSPYVNGFSLNELVKNKKEVNIILRNLE